MEFTTIICLRVVHIDNIFIDGIPEYNLTVGETYNLTAAVYPQYSFVQGATWSLNKDSVVTSNSVASITSDGKLTLKSVGSVNVFARSKVDSTVWTFVAIEVHPKANSITITNLPDNNTLYVGDTHQLGYVITPSSALKNVEWKSSDTSVATVDKNGKITARKAGNTKIKVYVENNSSIYDTIDLSVSLTQKSYIFYNEYGKNNEGHTEATLNQKLLAYKYYGGNTNNIEVVLIEDAIDFKEAWNEMTNNLGYVVVITHGTPEGLIRFNNCYSQDYFNELNKLLLDGKTGTPYNVTAETKNAHLLNGDIKKLDKKTIKGLVLLSCNGGHKDYIDTKIGNTAMAFSEIVNGAPVIASDGTVHYSEKISDEFKDIEEFQNLTIYEETYSSKHDQQFQTYSSTARKACGYSNVARETNDGWIIYKKVNGEIIYSDVPNNEYEQGNFMPKAKNFTFSKLLELIHS